MRGYLLFFVRDCSIIHYRTRENPAGSGPVLRLKTLVYFSGAVVKACSGTILHRSPAFFFLARQSRLPQRHRAIPPMSIYGVRFIGLCKSTLEPPFHRSQRTAQIKTPRLGAACGGQASRDIITLTARGRFSVIGMILGWATQEMTPRHWPGVPQKGILGL